ncbi:MAG: hypothetical protein OEL79_01525 [Chromatiales bacterium]|nr:hypothetical protein [Chromatiales bacterium]
MDIFLQAWGGIFYLANKIYFSLSETKIGDKKNQFKLIAWSTYLIGVPAWIVLLIGKNDWIAASIEAGGIPAMLLGLYKTFYKTPASPLVELAVKYITYFAIAFGVFISVQHYGGITSISQFLEIGVTLGFLMGSYLMTQHNSNGYLFFVLMNLSMASLMFLQDKNILMVQQLVSLLFVIYGYSQSTKTQS